MRGFAPLLAVAGVAALTACVEPGVDVQAEGAALMQLSRDWAEIAATGDLEALTAFWADDAILMPPGVPPIEGKAAIREYVEEAMQMPGFSITWRPLSVHVAASGDLAYMIETNVSTVNDSTGTPVTMHGKGVTVWRKDAEGNWKNVVDQWSPIPAPGT